MNEIILTCKRVTFYSLKDEDAFFEWIKKMMCIESISAQYNELYLHISKKRLLNQELDDLIGLFSRYKIKNMHQLAQFLNSRNKKWFYDNPSAFWYKRVFGTKVTKKK